MIEYRTNGFCHLFSVFALRGSVLPTALCWGVFAGCLALCVYHYGNGFGRSLMGADIRLLEIAFSQSYFTIMGFLLALRAQMAYTRYWEAVTLLSQARGTWLNAVSSVIAFSNPDPHMKLEVAKFQQLMIRLMSLLFSSALQQVCMMEDKEFETIDLAGIDDGHLSFLSEQKEKCEIILQWIQKLITDGVESKIQCAPPPIMSRVFQELANGIVNINDARKISTIPFPFPFAQMCIFLLLVYSGLSAIICGWYSTRADYCFAISFLTNFIFWSVYYTAIEIEMPFRDAPNGLDIGTFSTNMNSSLLILLDDNVILPPSFHPVDTTGSAADLSGDFGLQVSAVCTSSCYSRVTHVTSRATTLTTTVNWEQLREQLKVPPHMRAKSMHRRISPKEERPRFSSSNAPSADSQRPSTNTCDRQTFASSSDSPASRGDGRTPQRNANRGDGTVMKKGGTEESLSLFVSPSVTEEASQSVGVTLGRDRALSNEARQGCTNSLAAI